MAGTRPESDGGTTAQLTKLAHAIEHIDRDRDSRDCPHDCHGSLDVDDDGRVICESCRCTPDGVYIPPKETRSSGSNPKGSWGENTLPDGGYYHCTFFEPIWPIGKHPWADSDRERYRNSNEVVLAGGFEEAWPHEKTSRDDSLI